jgi:hypothetical protein
LAITGAEFSDDVCCNAPKHVLNENETELMLSFCVGVKLHMSVITLLDMDIDAVPLYEDDAPCTVHVPDTLFRYPIS